MSKEMTVGEGSVIKGIESVEGLKMGEGAVAQSAVFRDGKSRRTYYDFVEEAAKPISDRIAMIKARSGKLRAVRRHHLDVRQQRDIFERMNKEGRFISPYKEFGGYWGATQALSELGTGEFHSVSEIIKSYQKVMSGDSSKDKSGRTAWDRFKNKRSRSQLNGLDWYGRILQNYNVLQRLGGDDPYGLKLAQIGACIDLKKDDSGDPMVRLRVNIPAGEPVIPINELKQRHCDKSVSSIPSQILFGETLSSSRRKTGQLAISGIDQSESA